MDKQTVILTLEELGFALTALGAEDMASGLLQSYYGELTEDRWELLFHAATHSLISKGLMEQRADEQQQLEFDEFIVEMLAHLVQSRQMLRGYKEQQDKQNTLTIHHGNERFLYHFSSHNELHFFRWSSPEDWHHDIDQLFGLLASNFNEHSRYVDLTEEQWNELTSSNFSMQQMTTWKLHESAQQMIQDWREDFDRNQCSLDNLSQMIYADTDEDGPSVTNLLFVLKGTNDVWIVRNTELGMQATPCLRIESVTEADWRERITYFIQEFVRDEAVFRG
ncbi:hypothetical protein GMA19_03414 [Paenibacillus polymyxa E681]|uniref:hypothetical protein n=1 Tax=Paenibacillus polymyxa TaxID=1406 RepID=UPI0001E31921|nr:hypothetical protein [Paenibacillus polymyxa]ADM71221.1 hypothetical protein PPE_03403 [Paenibacillus polymyxa E681]QNV58243.1 hypothetical protein GE561_03416 [Paenibacillus polymyxa E681]QNV63078.1 hypothetical protein GMA19_03414 [Paenibacillus polymyxa E681]